MRMSRVLVKRQRTTLETLIHWNRRTWQEIVIMNARINALEQKTQADTGGESETMPKGDPWEPEYATNYLAVGWAFIGGFIAASLLWIALLWG